MTGFGMAPELHEGGTLCLICDHAAPPGEEIVHADWCRPVPPHVGPLAPLGTEFAEQIPASDIFATMYRLGNFIGQ